MELDHFGLAGVLRCDLSPTADTVKGGGGGERVVDNSVVLGRTQCYAMAPLLVWEGGIGNWLCVLGGITTDPTVNPSSHGSAGIATARVATLATLATLAAMHLMRENRGIEKNERTDGDEEKPRVRCTGRNQLIWA